MWWFGGVRASSTLRALPSTFAGSVVHGGGVAVHGPWLGCRRGFHGSYTERVFGLWAIAIGCAAVGRRGVDVAVRRGSSPFVAPARGRWPRSSAAVREPRSVPRVAAVRRLSRRRRRPRHRQIHARGGLGAVGRGERGPFRLRPAALVRERTCDAPGSVVRARPAPPNAPGAGIWRSCCGPTARRPDRGPGPGRAPAPPPRSCPRPRFRLGRWPDRGSAPGPPPRPRTYRVSAG